MMLHVHMPAHHRFFVHKALEAVIEHLRRHGGKGS